MCDRIDRFIHGRAIVSGGDLLPYTARVRGPLPRRLYGELWALYEDDPFYKTTLIFIGIYVVVVYKSVRVYYIN